MSEFRRRTIIAAKPYEEEIEYLQSYDPNATGTGSNNDVFPIIDTEIYGTADLDFNIKFWVDKIPTSSNTGYGSIFGAREEYNRRAYQLTTFKSSAGNGGHFDFGSNGINSNYLLMQPNTVMTIKKERNVVTRANGTTFTINTPSFTTPYSIILFGSRNGQEKPSESGVRCSLKIYSVSFSRNNEKILDLIPVRIGTTGYMYDKVSRQLFGNSGTGNFILPPGGGV